MASRGVYFLANDRVLDLAIAFLNSFRRFNPDLPLCLIPYADDVGQLLALADRYRFTVFAPPALLAACDAISRRFHERVNGHYRKLAIWEGPFEAFAYIDVDTVVLGPIDPVIDLAEEFAFVAGSSDLPELRPWVWQDSIHATGALPADAIAYSANTGFLASRRGVLGVAAAEARLAAALELAPHMTLHCVEQPFLNYLIVTTPQPRTSLLVLDRERRPGIRTEYWAGSSDGRVVDGQLVFRDRRLPALFVHWAGLWQATAWDVRVHRWLVRLRLRRPSRDPARRPLLLVPNWRLWRHYRWIGPPAS